MVDWPSRPPAAFRAAPARGERAQPFAAFAPARLPLATAAIQQVAVKALGRADAVLVVDGFEAEFGGGEVKLVNVAGYSPMSKAADISTQ